MRVGETAMETANVGRGRCAVAGAEAQAEAVAGTKREVEMILSRRIARWVCQVVLGNPKAQIHVDHL